MSPGGLWVLDDELEKGGWKQVICGEYEFCLGTRVKVWVTCIKTTSICGIHGVVHYLSIIILFRDHST